MYDRDCAFCVSWVERWQSVLAGAGLQIAALQEDWVAPALGLHPDEVLTDFCVYLRDGRLYRGPAAYRYVMKHVIWLKPLYYLFEIPFLRELFDVVYRRVRDNRHCLRRSS